MKLGIAHPLMSACVRYHATETLHAGSMLPYSYINHVMMPCLTHHVGQITQVQVIGETDIGTQLVLRLCPHGAMHYGAASEVPPEVVMANECQPAAAMSDTAMSSKPTTWPGLVA